MVTDWGTLFCIHCSMLNFIQADTFPKLCKCRTSIKWWLNYRLDMTNYVYFHNYNMMMKIYYLCKLEKEPQKYLLLKSVQFVWILSFLTQNRSQIFLHKYFTTGMDPCNTPSKQHCLWNIHACSMLHIYFSHTFEIIAYILDVW